ncbi:MAG TPA: tetratricopeptide repeat protein [Bryobacteraceae bacterium]|nr:tetratricopeptide repeat protein [Bryobacteraceae bacterium]
MALDLGTMPPDDIVTGERMLNLGRFEEALACFAAKEEADLQALFGSAVARQMLGRFEEAEERYERLLAVDPKHQEALANLIAMNVERFHLGRVEEYSRRLLELNSRSAAALQGLVMVAVERRDYEAAARYFRQIVPAGAHGGDAIEYRLSRQTVERLRSY